MQALWPTRDLVLTMNTKSSDILPLASFGALKMHVGVSLEKGDGVIIIRDNGPTRTCLKGVYFGPCHMIVARVAG